MDMQQAYATADRERLDARIANQQKALELYRADLERLQARVYDLLKDNEQLRAELNLSRGCCKALQEKIDELEEFIRPPAPPVG